MLDDLKDLLDLAFAAHRETLQARGAHAGSATAWASLNLTADLLDQAIDALLGAYVLAAAYEKATTPTPEVVA